MKRGIKMEKVRIQDDLYNYVNGEWLEKAVIPEILVYDHFIKIVTQFCHFLFLLS